MLALCRLCRKEDLEKGHEVEMLGFLHTPPALAPKPGREQSLIKAVNKFWKP